MFNRTLSALAAVALTGATLAISTPAFAQGDDAVAVGFGDLDLSTAAGSQRFERRVRQAATAVCGEFSRDLRLNEAIGACKGRAIAAARADAQVAMAARPAAGRMVALRTN